MATSSLDPSLVVLSKSFDANLFQSARAEVDTQGLNRNRRPSPARPSVIDIETLEEIEDRIALGQVPALANTVHFRSRLSLIPEQVPSTVEECEEPSDSSHAFSLEENSPIPTRRSRLQNVFSGLLSRRKSKETLNQSSEMPSQSS
nr:unnamed protein product [Haemonchus contortus]